MTTPHNGSQDPLNDPYSNPFAQPAEGYPFASGSETPPAAPQHQQQTPFPPQQVPFPQQQQVRFPQPAPFEQQQTAFPQTQYAMGGGQAPAQQKSVVVAALLAFFLGTLGVHNFYLGYTGRGVAQLALTVVGWITAVFLVGFVLLFAVGVWVLVDLIMIIARTGTYSVDAQGVPLQ
ncbi:TM2 domain-containing protein [Corynebacterium pacaense]|uniref:TM2 domain-containing protein n=1 Tax=Corynebacterium pacaense TaxID=1816684 RepID=UPI0009BADF58|nr:TM2 domain-containing protein [Corynebacterium pacaense]